MPSIRVMIVDDHEVVRTGLTSILGAEPGLEVVGQAASADEALRQMRSLRPDIILMDVRMEGLSGIEACRLIRSTYDETKVLMLTSYGEEEAVLASIMAGASGYLLKNVRRSALIDGIRAVADGKNLLDPAVTGDVLERLAALASAEQDRAVAALSEREREVLVLIGEGCTNREIGERLYISENTVRNHVSNVMAKLGAARRTEAAVFAARHGLLDGQGKSRS